MPAQLVKNTSPQPGKVVDNPEGVLTRLNVHVLGMDGPTLLLCNGFNCSQAVWHYLTPTLAKHYRLVLFDQVGTGQADPGAYDAKEYATLARYAQDVLEICRALDLRDVTTIGHSAGAMIALLAAIREPAYFVKAVLIAASPCYLNEPGYYGGFELPDVLDLLAMMEQDYQKWAASFALMILGQEYSAALGHELAGYFSHANPVAARQMLYMNFLGDNRPDLPKLKIPALLLQCAEDPAAPFEVGQYLVEHLPNATLVRLKATGHCPHISAPLEVLAALQPFLPMP